MVLFRKLWKRKNSQGACISLPDKFLSEVGIPSDAMLRISYDPDTHAIILEIAK